MGGAGTREAQPGGWVSRHRWTIAASVVVVPAVNTGVWWYFLTQTDCCHGHGGRYVVPVIAADVLILGLILVSETRSGRSLVWLPLAMVVAIASSVVWMIVTLIVRYQAICPTPTKPGCD